MAKICTIMLDLLIVAFC